jgi:restriction system protein
MIYSFAQRLSWFAVLAFILLLGNQAFPASYQELAAGVCFTALFLGLLGLYAMLLLHRTLACATILILLATAAFALSADRQAIAFFCLVWAILIALFSFWLGRHLEFWLAGKVPEWCVKITIAIAKTLFPRGPVRAIHSVLLDIGVGEFTEIDHVVITRAGVLVIETKGYTGSIRVNPESGHWERSKGGDTETLRNPVEQNRGHIRAIQAMGLGLPVCSLVVLPRASRKGPMPEDVIFGLAALWRVVRARAAQQQGGIGDQQLESCFNRLNSSNRDSPSNRRMHAVRVYRQFGQPGDLPPVARELRWKAGLLVGFVLLSMPWIASVGMALRQHI